MRHAKRQSQSVPRLEAAQRPRRRGRDGGQQVEDAQDPGDRVADDDDPAPAQAAAGPPGGEVGVGAGAEGRVHPGAEDEVLV